MIEEKIKLESQFKEKQLSIISEHNDKIKNYNYQRNHMKVKLKINWRKRLILN